MARRLLLLNGLATFGVVLNHASSWAFIGMFWWTDRYRDTVVPNFDQLGGPSYYLLRFLEQAVAFTVPSFLFVSGFFIAFVGGRQPLLARWTNAWGRIGTLLIPYLLWSTILLVERFIMGERFSPAQTLLIYLMGRAADPYYYIPVLCQCLLLSPLLIEGARKHWKAVLMVAGLLHVLVLGQRYAALLGSTSPLVGALAPLTLGWLFPGKVLWFALGIVVALHLEDAQNNFRKYRWLCAGLAIALVPLGMMEWEFMRLQSPERWIDYYDTLVDSFYAISIIVVATTFTSDRLPFVGTIQSVGKQSYGVYLMHSLVVAYGARLVYHFAPRLLGVTPLYYVCLVVVGLGAPLIVMTIVRQSKFNGSYKYIFG